MTEEELQAIEEMQAEWRRLSEENSWSTEMQEDIDQMLGEDIPGLVAEVRLLRSVLEQYVDPDNWGESDRGGGQRVWCGMGEGAELARVTLAGEAGPT